MNILVTGSKGDIGSYLMENLDNATALSHQDCDLTDWKQVKKVKWEGQAIIHCACATQYNKGGRIEDDIKMFVNLRRRWPKAKLIAFGSGAMYDRTQEIIKVSSDYVAYPKDNYSLSKRLTVDLADVTLIIFGLEADVRFIKAVKETPNGVQIYQDTLFSWVKIEDLPKIINWAIKEGKGRYNLCSYDMSLTDMALKYGATNIKYLQPGIGLEYTGQNEISIC